MLLWRGLCKWWSRESDKAKKESGEGGGVGNGEGDVDLDGLVRVPIVRMKVGEVAESSVVAILPVCKAERREIELEAAPWLTLDSFSPHNHILLSIPKFVLSFSISTREI
ncbi:Rubisco accumulation factor 1 [Forsythia ovata]|uniref:Rubisco accumulation factor 1 n=1 Tax=Forsythia ovata TaxID=205694 RepID=A0ABD1VMI5_9LAMI